MLFYFEFEEKRRKADVLWPKQAGNIVVHLADKELIASLPTDLFFELDKRNKVNFIAEDPSNKRLLELQTLLSRRLQELVNR